MSRHSPEKQRPGFLPILDLIIGFPQEEAREFFKDLIWWWLHHYIDDYEDELEENDNLLENISDDVRKSINKQQLKFIIAIFGEDLEDIIRRVLDESYGVENYIVD